MEECGPCPVFASFTLAFALQLRKKHGKTSVRLRITSVRLRKTSVRVRKTSVRLRKPSVRVRKTSVRLRKTSVRLRKTSVRVKKTSVRLRKTSVRVRKTSVRLRKTSVRLRKTSVTVQYTYYQKHSHVSKTPTRTGEGMSSRCCSEGNSNCVACRMALRACGVVQVRGGGGCGTVGTQTNRQTDRQTTWPMVTVAPYWTVLRNCGNIFCLEGAELIQLNIQAVLLPQQRKKPNTLQVAGRHPNTLLSHVPVLYRLAFYRTDEGTTRNFVRKSPILNGRSKDQAVV